MLSNRRPCPVCDSEERRDIRSLPLTFGGRQIISYCYNCQMVYASSAAPPVDYDEGSIYALPGALGSGESENDARRLREVAETIKARGYSASTKILDIGCAQGGLMAALEAEGFAIVEGVDLSAACVKVAQDRGLKAYHLPEHPPQRRYGLITLSHVLEHVRDVKTLLRFVWGLLLPGGHIYIEVPDASRYYEFPIPFMDFNSEHINHFTPNTLMEAIGEAGLTFVTDPKRKKIALPHGDGYPAIWMIAGPPPEDPMNRMINYVAHAESKMRRINAYLEEQLKYVQTVAIWGVNSYCANITSLPVFGRVMILQAVDRNLVLHGRKPNCGAPVQSPDDLMPDIPIVITTLMAIDSIRADIQSRGLKNRVISIPKEAYE